MMYNVFYFQVRSGWMAFHTQCALVAKTCQAKPGWLLVKLKLLKNWLSQHKTPAFQNCKKKKLGVSRNPSSEKSPVSWESACPRQLNLIHTYAT